MIVEVELVVEVESQVAPYGFRRDKRVSYRR